MKIELLKNFIRDESGAVTVDWVVLTAAIVGLGIAVILAVSTGVNSLGSKISSSLSEGQVNTLSGLADAAKGNPGNP
jgi:Flp pilus assembly pilin Flp